jgi:hypothetical protein
LQEEILYARGLVKKLSGLGNLLQFLRDDEGIRVRGLMMGQPEIIIDISSVDHPVLSTDPIPLLESAWKGEFSSAANFFLAREISELSVKPGFDQLLSFQIAQG